MKPKNPGRRLTLIAVLVLGGVGGCATASEPQLTRGKEQVTYRLLITGASAGESTEAVVELGRVDASTEYFLIREAVYQAPGEPKTAIQLDSDCRKVFGGDRLNLGRVTFAETVDLNQAIPPCVPEPLWIACVDFLSFVLIQSDPHFGLAELRRPGDEVRFTSFSEHWERPLEQIAGQVSCTGGITRFDRLEKGKARVRWQPDIMVTTMVRAAPGMQDTRMLMDVEEKYAAEIEIDAATGTLLGGKSLYDDSEVSMWLPYAGRGLPEGTGRPGEPVHRVTATRSLVLAVVP